MPMQYLYILALQYKINVSNGEHEDNGLLWK